MISDHFQFNRIESTPHIAFHATNDGDDDYDDAGDDDDSSWLRCVARAGFCCLQKCNFHTHTKKKNSTNKKLRQFTCAHICGGISNWFLEPQRAHKR